MYGYMQKRLVPSSLVIKWVLISLADNLGSSPGQEDIATRMITVMVAQYYWGLPQWHVKQPWETLIINHLKASTGTGTKFVAYLSP